MGGDYAEISTVSRCNLFGGRVDSSLGPKTLVRGGVPQSVYWRWGAHGMPK
jgi:hypothetical protein